jgi:UDP-glucose 4-epimerase
MKNKNIIVTGGAGFIGSHLVDALLAQNNKVIIIDSLISSSEKYIEHHFNLKNCTFIKADIRNINSFKQIKIPIDMIFHLAADPDVKTSVENPTISFDHNVAGTLNVLEFARINDIDSFFFASSGGTLYGDVDTFPIKESVLLNPISPYGASKAASEMYISAYANAYNIKSFSGRLANILGERSQHGVCYDFYMKLKRNPKQLEILGNGMQKKSYLHVSDCINAILSLVDILPEYNSFYDYFNIGSYEWVTVNQIAKIIEENMGLFNVNHTYSGGKKGWVGDIHKMLLSVEKIKDFTGWMPSLSIEKSIKRYIEWLEENN